MLTNSVQWFGCNFTPDETPASCPTEDKDRTVAKTRDASKKEDYRHFAYDAPHKILYFCDLNPYREGMSCYCSNRTESDKNQWLGKWTSA